MPSHFCNLPLCFGSVCSAFRWNLRLSSVAAPSYTFDPSNAPHSYPLAVPIVHWRVANWNCNKTQDRIKHKYFQFQRVQLNSVDRKMHSTIIFCYFDDATQLRTGDANATPRTNDLIANWIKEKLLDFDLVRWKERTKNDSHATCMLWYLLQCSRLRWLCSLFAFRVGL